jgi:hypothetical protein
MRRRLSRTVLSFGTTGARVIGATSSCASCQKQPHNYVSRVSTGLMCSFRKSETAYIWIACPWQAYNEVQADDVQTDATGYHGSTSARTHRTTPRRSQKSPRMRACLAGYPVVRSGAAATQGLIALQGRCSVRCRSSLRELSSAS